MKLTPDDRNSAIINILLNSSNFVNTEEIASLLGLSKRNVYYGLNEINELLEKNGCGKISQTYGKGFLLTKEQRNILSRQSSANESLSVYSLSQIERISLLYCELIFSKIRNTTDYIADVYFDISRQSVLSDTNALKDLCNSFDLVLKFDTRKGYFVSGDEFNIRRAFLFSFSNIYDTCLNKKSVTGRFSFVGDRTNDIYDDLLMINSDDNSYYVSSLVALSCLIDRIRRKDGSISEQSLASYDISRNSKELAFIENSFSDLPDPEKRYIASYLISSRINSSEDIDLNIDIENLADRMIEKYNYLTKENIDEESFRNKLVVHLKLAYIRYLYGICIDNPIINDIKKKYGLYFSVVKEVCKLIEESIHGLVNDNEIGFITLYFAGRSIRYKGEDKVTVSLICLNGLATSYILKNEIEDLDSRIEVIECIGVHEYENRSPKGELIFSTVDLYDAPEDIVIINPILSLEDKIRIEEKIEKHLNRNSGFSYEKIWKIVRPYVDENRQEELRLKLIDLQNDDEKESQYVFNRHLVNITDADTWQDAVRKACMPLEKQGFITDEFAEEIIANGNEYENYSTFYNRYFLAHASAEKSKGLALSFTKLKKPVDFSGVRLNKIFVFTPVNHKDHLDLLNRLIGLFPDDELYEKIENCDTVEDLYRLLTKIF